MQSNLPTIKLNTKEYTWDELQPYFLGRGSERWCFRDPQNNQKVIKISLKGKIKQTKREIKYFSFLKKRQIPFTHIPVYYEKLEGKDYLGLSQEFIRNYDESLSESFPQYMEQNPVQAKKLLQEFYIYLHTYNILPCDFTAGNMVVVSSVKNRQRIVLLDGLGCTDFIPLAQYHNFWGRLKIRRKLKAWLLSNSFKKLFTDVQEIESFLGR